MKPPALEYARPGSLDDAVRLLAEAGEGGKVLAGGQSLTPMLNFRLARPAVLIDVGRLEELGGCERENGTLVIGAGMRQREAERSEVVRSACPLIPEALRHVGHLQIRTRGTIGGSIAHADPAAELPAVAVALDAELVARGARGERRVAARDFFLGPYMSDLADDEILVALRFPVIEGWAAQLVEFAPRSGDFAHAGVAIALRLDAGTKTVLEARMAAFGVGATVTRLGETEGCVAGHPLSEETIAAAAGAAAGEISPPSGDEEDALYKGELLATLVARGLRAVAR